VAFAKDLPQALAVLGLTPQADHAAAKAAHRALAMRWHPDVSGGIDTEGHMKSINVAYAMVSRHLDGLAKSVEAGAQPAKSQATS
jgi:curved DNA-binding protein CbpA